MASIHFSLAQIEAFACICETKSLTLAAKRLRKNRTTIGELLETLEINLGYTLFNRAKRPLQLTEEGQQLYAQARLFLQEAEIFNQIAKQLPENIQHNITLCYDCFTPIKLLTTIADFFNELGINVHFLCVERNLAEQLLLDGKAGIGIYQAMNQVTNERFKCRAIGSVELGVYAGLTFFPSSHKTIGKLELVSHRQLIPYQILPDYLIKHLRIANTIQKVTDITLLKNLLSRNGGWSILPTHFFEEPCHTIKRYHTELCDKGMFQTLVALWLPETNKHIEQIIQRLAVIFDEL